MVAMHQFIPTFAPHDAIGNHTRGVRDVLRGLGIRSDIYVDGARGELASECRDYRSFRGDDEPTWLLYQASTGSPMGDFLVDRPEPVIVDYHNITPASFFAPWEPHVGAELHAGRRQLAALAPRAVLGLADSEYNRLELDALGYRPSAVLPILLDTADFERAWSTATHDRLRAESAGSTSWLFVGRVSPHKAQHDIVKAFAVYRRTYDPGARLRLVGSPASARYLSALGELIGALGLDGVVELVGNVSDADLSAHYRAADVFVVLSDHEGFNVPLLEAMHHGTPIVAYAAAAVPETLGDGGLCLPDKAPTLVAAAVHRVASDGALRAALVAAGRRRLADFDIAVTRARLVELVEGVVGR